MKTIEGTSRNLGMATAVAAVVDIKTGINGVSPALLQSGIDALRRGVPPEDYPEAVIACDNLAFGLSIRIPGVRTVALAVQSEHDAAGMEIDVPCVIGLPDLLRSIKDGDILIVDGNRGAVHIDPDPQTLVHYQQIEEQHEAPSRIFISAEHLPARTQSGEMVTVYAHVSDETELTTALDGGADGLIVDVRGREFECGDYYRTVLGLAAGKPVAFAVEFAPRDLLHAAARLAAHGQVTILLPPEDLQDRLAEAHQEVENAAMEAFLEDLSPPKVDFGVLVDSAQYEPSADGANDIRLFIDAREATSDDDPLSETLHHVPEWIGLRNPGDVVVVLDTNLDIVRHCVRAGARAVSIASDRVGECKYAIRCIGEEEEAD